MEDKRLPLGYHEGTYSCGPNENGRQLRRIIRSYGFLSGIALNLQQKERRARREEYSYADFAKAPAPVAAQATLFAEIGRDIIDIRN